MNQIKLSGFVTDLFGFQNHAIPSIKFNMNTYSYEQINLDRM